MENTIGMILQLGEVAANAGGLALWLPVTYGAVLGAMAVDFVTGVGKARRAGIATNSRGLKMTCSKAGKYFLPMMCLSFIDLIAVSVMRVPALTMAMGAFNIYCEWRSVMESTHDKGEMREAERIVQLLLKNRGEMLSLLKREERGLEK